MGKTRFFFFFIHWGSKNLILWLKQMLSADYNPSCNGRNTAYPYPLCHLLLLYDGLSSGCGTAQSSPLLPAVPYGPRATVWRTLWGRRLGPWSCCWSAGCSATGRRRRRLAAKKAAGRHQGNPRRMSWRMSWPRPSASADHARLASWRAAPACGGSEEWVWLRLCQEVIQSPAYRTTYSVYLLDHNWTLQYVM